MLFFTFFTFQCDEHCPWIVWFCGFFLGGGTERERSGFWMFWYLGALSKRGEYVAENLNDMGRRSKK